MRRLPLLVAYWLRKLAPELSAEFGVPRLRVLVAL